MSPEKTKGSQSNPYRIGDKVVYGGRTYTVLSVKYGDICGPHYRMGAYGDDPSGDYPALTSWQLLHPAEEQ